MNASLFKSGVIVIMSLIARCLSAVFAILLTSTCAFAETHDFLGAMLENKMVPSSYWTFGVTGYKLTVNVIKDETLAFKFGFRVSDLIIKVDGVEVNNVGYLLGLSDGKHSIKVFRKKEFVDIDVLVPTKVKASAKGVNINSSLPAVQVNTDDLERKYGVNEKRKNNKKRSYQQCMEDEMARADTYEYYLNNPNTGYGYQGDRKSLDYKRARKICDEESDAVKVLIMNY